MLLDIRRLPALDAVDDHHAAPEGQRHAGERQRGSRGGRVGTLEQLHPAAVGARFGERAQVRAAGGDRRVVIAADQVQRPELGHA